MNIYFDTSAIVKLFVDEVDSAQVHQLAAQASFICTSVVAYAECRAALAAMHRADRISRRELEHYRGEFDLQWPDLFVVDVGNAIAQRAGELAERFALRGFDAIHLACFDRILTQSEDEITFCSFDARLARAARRLRSGPRAQA